MRLPRHSLIARISRCISRWLPVVLLVIASTLLLASPAHAHARRSLTGGDTVALSINTSTFTYGDTVAPMFKAVVTFGTKPTQNSAWNVSIKLDDGESFASFNETSISPDGLSITFMRITSPNPIASGQRTATATFFNPGTNTTATSNAVDFTVNKADIATACNVHENDVHFLGLGESIHVVMSTSLNAALPAEWQYGTFTVTFDGPTHSTFTNLSPSITPQGLYQVEVTTPTQLGHYTMTCAYDGSANYNTTSFVDTATYTISALHSLGSINLYANPTPLTPQTTTTLYLVLHAGPGLPPPTGYFQIYMGNYNTHDIPLGASGDILGQIVMPPSFDGISKITIHYWGDTYYDTALIDFSLSLPPIPNGISSGNGTGGSGGSGGIGGGGGFGNGNAPKGTATTTATASATGTAGSATSTPATVGVALPHSTDTGDSGIPLAVIVLAPLLSLLVLAVLAGLAIYLLRRRRLTQAAALPMSNGYGGYDRPSQVWQADETYPSSHRDD